MFSYNLSISAAFQKIKLYSSTSSGSVIEIFKCVQSYISVVQSYISVVQSYISVDTILYKCCTILYKCWYISGLYEEEGLYCYVRYVLIFHKTSMLYNNELHCGNLLYVCYWSMRWRILYVKGYNIIYDIQRLTHL